MPPTRKIGYKKRNLLGVKLGREVPKTIFGLRPPRLFRLAEKLNEIRNLVEELLDQELAAPMEAL